jgi:hypothetical protein
MFFRRDFPAKPAFQRGPGRVAGQVNEGLGGFDLKIEGDECLILSIIPHPN